MSASRKPTSAIPRQSAPNRFMTHLAMQEVDDQGSPVSWGEHVSDEEYGVAPPIDQ